MCIIINSSLCFPRPLNLYYSTRYSYKKLHFCLINTIVNGRLLLSDFYYFASWSVIPLDIVLFIGPEAFYFLARVRARDAPGRDKGSNGPEDAKDRHGGCSPRGHNTIEGRNFFYYPAWKLLWKLSKYRRLPLRGIFPPFFVFLSFLMEDEGGIAMKGYSRITRNLEIYSSSIPSPDNLFFSWAN